MIEILYFMLLCLGQVKAYPAWINLTVSAFGISLCQFFSEGSTVALTSEQEDLLERWALLSPEQKAVLLDLMRKMN